MKVLHRLSLSSYVQHDIQKATCTLADLSEKCTLNKIRELNFDSVIPSLFRNDVIAPVEKLQEKYCIYVYMYISETRGDRVDLLSGCPNSYFGNFQPIQVEFQQVLTKDIKLLLC